VACDRGSSSVIIQISRRGLSVIKFNIGFALGKASFRIIDHAHILNDDLIALYWSYKILFDCSLILTLLRYVKKVRLLLVDIRLNSQLIANELPQLNRSIGCQNAANFCKHLSKR